MDKLHGVAQPLENLKKKNMLDTLKHFDATGLN